MEKIVLIIADGVGDRPVKELNYKTPIEFANKPNLNKMAKEGITGLMHTVGRGIRPGSDVAHLSIFGYSYEKYYAGRGAFEVLGIPMELKPGDIAFRGNLATVKDGIIVDRRAGRMESYEVIPKHMIVTIEDVTFFLEPSVLHRVGVIMRGQGLTANIYDVDPHKEGEKPRRNLAKEDNAAAKKTERILNEFMDYMHNFLEKNEVIVKRKNEGKPFANYLTVRGPGQYMEVPSFKEKYGLKACCISGADLYKGVARYLGMDIIDVPGANGRVDSDLNAKVKYAISKLDEYDFIFVHMKFADSLAEIGDYNGKVKFIEKIDASLAPLFNRQDMIVFFSGDHTTPCSLKAHSGDPVPALIWGPKEAILTDEVTEFGERPCQKGGLGHFNGMSVMEELINLCGKQKLIGD